MAGLKKWPVTAWRTLLKLALGPLDALEPQIHWALGGGTALALKLNHRISYDVDIFIENTAALCGLSPNRNKASRALSQCWQESGNDIKIERPEGAIDFILAARQSDLSPWIYRFKARDIFAEDPAEILAKKLKYRGSRLLPRDIFDLIAAHRYDPALLKAAVSATPEGARRAADRITRIAKRYQATIQEEVNPTSGGVDLLDSDPQDLIPLLETWTNQ